MAVAGLLLLLLVAGFVVVDTRATPTGDGAGRKAPAADVRDLVARSQDDAEGVGDDNDSLVGADAQDRSQTDEALDQPVESISPPAQPGGADPVGPGASPGVSAPPAETGTVWGPCPDPVEVTSALTGVTPENGADDQVRLAGRVTNATFTEIVLQSATIDLYDADGNPVDTATVPLSDLVAAGATFEWSVVAVPANPGATQGALTVVDFVWSGSSYATCPHRAEIAS